MPSSWVNVSPGKMTVRKVKRVSFSLSQAEIVITAQTQIATTSVSVNITFFMFVLRLELVSHCKMDTKDGAHNRHTTGFGSARHPVELRIARLGKKRSQRFWLHCCAGPIPKHLRRWIA